MPESSLNADVLENFRVGHFIAYLIAGLIMAVVFAIPFCFVEASLAGEPGAHSPVFDLPAAAMATRSAHDPEAPMRVQDTPYEGPRMFWDSGFRIEDPRERWKVKFGGKFIVDGGYLNTHGDVTRAFPDLEGADAVLRRLTVNVAGNIGPRFNFRAEVDFSEVQDVMDNWIRFKDIPYLGQLTLGHQKEPFSLDNLTSTHSKTFTEQSLAGDAMSPGRNIGIMANRPLLDEKMTAALGAYFNTGSIKNAGDAKNSIENRNGYDITGRLTGLPWYDAEGERLIHLGVSLSHQIRNDAEDDDGARFRARPESRLTDTRLVDSGEFAVSRSDLLNAELAMVLENLSFQGEIFYTSVDASDFDDPAFWGFYLYGSYFITGEHRNYQASRGLFGRPMPHRPTSFKEHEWGAWELALRFSHVDLNDGALKGGIESNWTAGLNWYWSPFTRLMFNVIHGHVRDRETQPAIESGSIDIVQARFQIAF